MHNDPYPQDEFRLRKEVASEEEWKSNHEINRLLYENDPDGLKALIEFAPKVEFLLRRQFNGVIDADDVRDIVTDAMLYTWQRRSTFGPAAPKATTIFIKRAVYDALTFMKRQRLESRVHIHSVAHEIADDLQQQCIFGDPALRHLLEGVLDRIPPKRAAAIRMRYFDDLSDEIIAQKLGISESSVRARVSRGCQDVRRILGDDFLDKR